jgi:hypothetical protein
MESKVKFRRIAAYLVLAMFPTSWAEFNPNFAVPDLCQFFDNIPTIELPANPAVVLEDIGKIKVMHGSTQAAVDTGGRIIKIEQIADIPNYANQAAVFLNGWRVGYTGDDQHVLAVAALITKISLDRRNLKLTWNAVGLIRDDDFEESYGFTYHYTLIAWNNTQLNLVVNQGRFCNPDLNIPDKSFMTLNNGTTALSSFNLFALEPEFPQGQPIAVLPRGFGFHYAGDHRLLQLAYNLEHSEVFAERGRLTTTINRFTPSVT